MVFGGLGLIIQTFISQLDNLSTQVGDGVDEVQNWLVQGPLHLSQAQLSDGHRAAADVADRRTRAR